MTRISAIICADWAKEQRKRAVFVADVGARTINCLHGGDWSIATLLDAAAPWRDRGPLLITLDAPLGVPASYLDAASRCPLWGSPKTFLDFLRCVWADPGYLDLVRGAALEALLTANWLKTQGVVIQDVDAAARSEDDFDACITAAALLRCVLEDTPLAMPNLTDSVAEGGILGSAAINLDLSERTFRPELGLTAVVEECVLPITDRAERPSTQYRCPIPGCDKLFRGSRVGWDGHVASLRIHPEWHPDLSSAEERKRQFVREFPLFFDQ